MSGGILLASSSPRRKELLTLIGIPFTIRAADVDETLIPGQPAESEAARLAVAKALAVAGQADYVVGADTMVVLPDRILGKPVSPQEAEEMLQSLRGREHRVVTGVAIVHGGDFRSSVRITNVRMRNYTDAEIAGYITSGEPFDKAGGYAIQDPTLRPVASLQDDTTDAPGCYCNVMGLPLHRLLVLLKEAGCDLPDITKPDQCATCPDWQ